ncbi:MAG TPA: ScpA family protein [Burkholderiales bacterium]|jgi:segregation and condensation protein A|nr:ScpA family protein [Burkholderiales bacterium]
MTTGENPPTDAPVARVNGDAFELPQDLYIPPDALEVFLETFQGPLDLLLYLIRKQNLNILDIPIAEVTRQYMGYIELMQELRLELAAEYLVMAAMLAEIKSRMLLPRPETQDEEDDPRAELIRRLQQYERYRQAAESIERMPRIGREIYLVSTSTDHLSHRKPPPSVALHELIDAFKQVMERAELYRHHRIRLEALSVRERMTEILARVGAADFIAFETLFEPREGRLGLVVTFMAILELIKESLIVVIQQEPYAPIHVKAAA